MSVELAMGKGKTGFCQTMIVKDNPSEDISIKDQLALKLKGFSFFSARSKLKIKTIS